MKSIWETIKEALSSWNSINAPRLGAALAFYTMLSLAPLLVITVAIAGFVFGRQATQGEIVSHIESVAGTAGAETIQSILQYSTRNSSGILATAIGSVLLFFSASGLFVELHDQLNTIWGLNTRREVSFMGMVRDRFFAFLLVLGVGLLLVISLIATAVMGIAGSYVVRIVPLGPRELWAIDFCVFFVALTLLFALIYEVVPDIDLEWKDVWRGAAVTSLLFSIGKFLIGLYLARAGVGSAYGAAGSLFVLLVWLYYSAQVFLLGAEFTHIFYLRRRPRPWKPGIYPPSERVQV